MKLKLDIGLGKFALKFLTSTSRGILPTPAFSIREMKKWVQDPSQLSHETGEVQPQLFSELPCFL